MNMRYNVILEEDVVDCLKEIIYRILTSTLKTDVKNLLEKLLEKLLCG